MSIKVSFINLSSIDFTGKHKTLAEEGLKTDITYPGDFLAARTGHQTMEIDQEVLSWYVDGNMETWSTWMPTTDGGKTFSTEGAFGVKTESPLQFLTIGKAPYWYAGHIKHGHNGYTWDIRDGHDKATPYTWAPAGKFTVLATPVCHHKSIDITVTITDLVKPMLGV